MVDEFNLQEELLSLTSDPSLYQIPNELDISSQRQSSLESILSEAIETIVNDPESILHSTGQTFDVFRSILKHSDESAVDAGILIKTLDSIVSSLTHHINSVMTLVTSAGFAEDMDAPMAHKTPLEMWAFLLQWFVTAAERGAGKVNDPSGASKPTKTGRSKKTTSSTGFIWADYLPTVLGVSQKALRMPTSRIWRTTSERESFVSCFVKPAYQLCETESHLKAIEVRTGIYRVICLAVKFNGHAFGAQTSIIQNLTYFEHLSEPMAELLEMLDKEFDYGQLGEEVLREVASKTFAHNDAKGPRSFSKFLVRLAEGSPRIVQKQMSLLLAHLDSEAHPMRMAIVEIIGILIKDIVTSDEGDREQKELQVIRFYELLMERYLDLNSWVRCKVLQTMNKLCDLPINIPKQRAKITELTIQTLQDKTSSARRYAIQLLCKMVETHPHGQLSGGTLNLAEWQTKYTSLCADLEKVDARELEQAKRDVGYQSDEEQEGGDSSKDQTGVEGPGGEKDRNEDAEEQGAEGEDEGTEGTPKPRPTKKKSRQSTLDVSAIEAEVSAIDPQVLQHLRALKKLYAQGLKFILQIESAIPTLCTLLVSTTKTEVLEAMRFFRTAYEYDVQGAELGIKTMLHLIWTKDNNSTNTNNGVEEGLDGKTVKGNLIEVYKSLYFDVVPDLAPKQQISRIAKNMIERTYGATLAELTSLEELMRTMMVDNGVHPDVVNKLWQVYSTEQEIPKPQRQGAIIILGMLAIAKKEVVTERVESLLKIGLGNLGMNDLVLARYTCIALQRLGGSAKKVKGSLADKTMRLPMDNPIFIKLQEIVENAPKSPQWFGMAEQAINTIYLLGEQPDLLCTSLIKNFTSRVFASPMNKPSTNNLDTEGEDDNENEMAGDVTMTPSKMPLSPAKTVQATPSKTPGGVTGFAGSSSPAKTHRSRAGSSADDKAGSFALAQLLFVVGHTAIKHIVYLELVEREFKRRKDETAKQKAAAKPVDKDSNDLDAVAGNAEDDIGDLIAGIREKELLYGENSLLAVYGPLVAHVCASPKRYRSPALRQAATLALTKLMCVSAQFCESHLLLLFKILETSKDPVVRSNIVIALGDIAVCFGSLIDDNSERLYQGLADSDLGVKKNTLMVLTHLILNGMIKVKGQLGEMAKCLEDPDQRISDLAKLFFTELSTKDNALYNNLQDVISHLSIGKHAVDEETFERTMRFIFTFIEKEKQAESIVEKLCQRFRLATEERQWRDISFCLSLLPFKSERSMKKLIEGLPFYQDKLHEETVFRRFTEILAKARANKNSNKPETELKEFEAILTEHQAKGLEEQALEADVARKTKAAKRKAAKRPVTSATAKGRKGRATREETEEPEIDVDTRSDAGGDEEDEEEAPRRPVAAKRGKAPPRRAGRRKAVVESDEEEDNDDA